MLRRNFFNIYKQIVLLFLLLSVFLCGQSTLAQEKSNLQGFDSFPIGVFFVRGQKPIFDVGDPKDFRSDPDLAQLVYEQEFGDLSAEGFNVAVLAINPLVFGDYYEKVLKVILSEAKNSGIRLIIGLPQIQDLLAETRAFISNSDIAQAACQDYFNLLKNSDAVIAYIIFDEPVPVDEASDDDNTVFAEQLGKVRKYLESKHPGVYALSTWADLNNMEALQNGMHSRVLFMDLYPLAESSEIGDFSDAWPRGNPDDGSFAAGEDQPSYFEYLEQSREFVPDVPQWLIVQAFEPIPPEHPHYWRMPTPAELRLEVFSGLAHGAKGIFYFLYQSETWVHGLRDENYESTALLDEVVLINKKISLMGDLLLSLKRDDEVGLEHTQGEAFAYLDNESQHYIFIVNTDVQKAANISIDLPEEWLGIKNALNVSEDTMIKIEGKTLSITVEPGDGYLLKLSE